MAKTKSNNPEMEDRTRSIPPPHFTMASDTFILEECRAWPVHERSSLAQGNLSMNQIEYSLY